MQYNNSVRTNNLKMSPSRLSYVLLFLLFFCFILTLYRFSLISCDLFSTSDPDVCEEADATDVILTTLTRAKLAAALQRQNSPCIQCDIWQKVVESRRKCWSHEDYVRKFFLETMKTAVSGYVTERALANKQKNVVKNDFNSVFGEKINHQHYGVTMVGLLRLNALQAMLEEIIAADVPGDFMECGVWRGGTSIFALAVLTAYDTLDRRVILADSFQGLPAARTAVDENFWQSISYLAVSLDDVQENFRRLGFFDLGNVVFVKDYFNESMPRAHRSIVGTLAVLRIDGDMYESCFDVLSHMYGHVAVGGYVIIDDWALPVCRQAIEEIRAELGISEPVHRIDNISVFWKKERQVDYSIEQLYNTLFNKHVL